LPSPIPRFDGKTGKFGYCNLGALGFPDASKQFSGTQTLQFSISQFDFTVTDFGLGMFKVDNLGIDN
jgi:hypothetical protein